eukprot:860043-Prymnesium_polylepis.1
MARTGSGSGSVLPPWHLYCKLRHHRGRSPLQPRHRYHPSASGCNPRHSFRTCCSRGLGAVPVTFSAYPVKAAIAAYQPCKYSASNCRTSLMWLSFTSLLWCDT